MHLLTTNAGIRVRVENTKYPIPHQIKKTAGASRRF